MTAPRVHPVATAASEAQPLWYKDAIVYELHVRAFADSNGDGIGDFRGLTEKLDYLQQLGVNTLWLLPFYPSPLRDGGYDIADYTSVNPQYGTMRDFTRFVQEAHRRGLRVVTELVINHTSDQHPWFQRARSAPRGSAARDWYVWSDTDTRYAGTRIIFTDTESSNWSWDASAGQYYWHRFFRHQPDLNFASPQVREAIRRVMKFWLDRGVDGLRLDAVPYLCEREGTNNENLPETHDVIRELRAYVDANYADRLLLAEANQWPEDVRAYFGDGDECHMAFHFPVMPRLYMSLRQEDRRPIVDILQQTPEIPPACQWGLFLRNHDELTLEMVTDEERDYMYSIYATDPRMRVNVGIRRRLAPLLDNSRRRIELLHGLLFSLPGTPILYYGDEIGMGDNIFLGDRDGVRTPMQWNGDRNAGFSRADPASLYLPLIVDPQYGYQAVNVEAQERSASSLLNWMRRMIALRAKRPAFGRGDLTILHPANRSIFAFVRRYEDAVTLVVANLSRFVQPAELDLSEYAGTVPVEVIGQQPFPAVGEDPYFLTLSPHAFYWFDLVPQPAPVAPVEDETEPAVAIEGGDWRRLLEGAARERLESDVLPAYLERQRWFGRRHAVRGVRIRSHVLVRDDAAAPAWIALAEVEGDAEASTYALTLAVTSGRGERALLRDAPAAAIARVQSGRGRAVLFDATASDVFARELLELLAVERPTGGSTRLLPETFEPFSALHEALDDPPPVSRHSGEQSNTTLRFGNQFMLKVLRRFELDPHPEIEMGRHLASHPAISPRLVGAIRIADAAGRGPLAVAHEFVWNRANGWDFTVATCLRFLDEHVALDPPPVPSRHPLILAREETGRPPSSVPEESPPDYAEHVSALGMATAELHLALADARGDPSFEPEPLTYADVDAVISRVRARLRDHSGWLREIAAGEDPRAAEHARAALTIADFLAGNDGRTRAEGELGQKIRIHGDYHLGQVVEADGRFVVLDFEGEVGLPVEERRKKASAFADLAGMLRSFGYASLAARSSQALQLPDDDQSRDRLAAWASWWEERARGAFLAAYLEAAAGAPFLPATDEAGAWLLDVHLIDKALHELEYEREYRPDWAAIPLEGLARIAMRMAGASS